MSDLLLGIDIGTGTVKAGVFSVAGDRIALVTSPYPADDSPLDPEQAEVAPETWQSATISALRELSTCVSLDRVAAVGLSTLYPALLLLDAQGLPLRPAILYCDLRSAGQVERARRSGLADRILAAAGCPLVEGTCSASSLMWVRDNEPDVFRRAAIVGHLTTFIGNWLTGVMRMDRISAPMAGIFSGARGTWDDDLATELGVAGRLPAVIGPAEPCGTITGDAAAATGLREGTPVALGGGDSVCATIGAGIYAPAERQALLVTGTTDTLCLVTDQPAYDARVITAGHPDPNLWVTLSTMTSTGGALQWLAEKVLLAPITDLLQQAEPSPAGARGARFLPYLRGERTPLWDPLARGVWWGMTDEAGRADLVRALLEGVSYGLRACIETSEAVCGSDVRELLAVGGPASSALWNQVRADVTGRPIVALAERECSVRGAAWMAARACGVADRPWPVPMSDAATFQPREQDAALHDRGYRQFCELYERLKGEDLFAAALAARSRQ